MRSTCCATAGRPWSAAPIAGVGDARSRRRRRAGAARRCTARCWRFWWPTGDRVEKGQRLAIIEAMKMEHTLTAPRAGPGRRDRGRGRQPGGGRRQADDDRADGRRLGRDMPLHLIKLSVGTDSIEDLEDWIKLKLKEQKQARRQEARAHPHHPHGAQARRGAARRRLDLLGDPRRNPLPRAHPRHPPVRRQGRHRPLPAGARSEMRAGAAAALPRVPGLALSRGQGRAARSRSRRARRRQHAGAAAARIARTRACSKPPDVVDQPRAAELGRDQQPDRAVWRALAIGASVSAWRASR